MTIAYITRNANNWTATLEGVTRFPTHTPIPLPFAASASWTVVADHVRRFVSSDAVVYFNGSQV